ncbi:MAG: CPBP family intramembrane glutamic endopeptidase [Hymenobacter sp.]
MCISLPLHGFELWARDNEDRAAGLTKFLTDFHSPGRLLVGLVVIAIVPAVAEELVFRGGVQRNLVAWFGSRHVGVWLAAAIFSAIHVQFFGFVPRFVLGLVLGYLYEWSGNILVSMAAHFTQNAFPAGACFTCFSMSCYGGHFRPRRQPGRAVAGRAAVGGAAGGAALLAAPALGCRQNPAVRGVTTLPLAFLHPCPTPLRPI